MCGWRSGWRPNLGLVWLCVKQALPYFRERGGKKADEGRRQSPTESISKERSRGRSLSLLRSNHSYITSTSQALIECLLCASTDAGSSMVIQTYPCPQWAHGLVNVTSELFHGCPNRDTQFSRESGRGLEGRLWPLDGYRLCRKAECAGSWSSESM